MLQQPQTDADQADPDPTAYLMPLAAMNKQTPTKGVKEYGAMGKYNLAIGKQINRSLEKLGGAST